MEGSKIFLLFLFSLSWHKTLSNFSIEYWLTFILLKVFSCLWFRPLIYASKLSNLKRNALNVMQNNVTFPMKAYQAVLATPIRAIYFSLGREMKSNLWVSTPLHNVYIYHNFSEHLKLSHNIRIWIWLYLCLNIGLANS